MDKIINLIFEAVILLIEENMAGDNIYIIVEEEFRDTFEENVNELLSKGYLPLGGVSTYVDKDG